MAKRKRVVLKKKSRGRKEKLSGLDKFFYGNFKLALKSLGQIKSYVLFSFVLFFVFSILGYIFPQPFEKQVLDLIKQLLEQTKGLNGFELIFFIISNNIKSAFFGLLFGVLFAIIPLGILIVNGYVLGFVANKAVKLESIFVLWKLLPHGIFEIPAIMISIGVGIRLGLFLFLYHGNNKRKEFWKWFKNALRIFIFIVVPLLVIAGIIEGILIWSMG